MNAKIAIVGFGDFIDIAKQVAKNFENTGTSIRILENSVNVTSLVPELESYEPDIIITGRLNKVLLEPRIIIPIINLRITPTDILIALKKSLPYSNQICIALPNIEDLEYDYSLLQDLLHVELTYITYSTQIELDYKMGQFSKIGGTVIGTGDAVNSAIKFGLKGILIYSQHSISESIDRALEIMGFKREEERHKKQLSAIIHSVKDGIIATNELDQVTIVNDSARKLLQIPRGESLGRRLSQVVSNKELLNREDFQNKILKFDQAKLNTNKISIFHKGNKVGNVITFQDLTEIQNIEQQYRIENEAKGFVAKNQFDDIIYSSEKMKDVIERAKRFSQTDSTVLIIGQTGTGKELVAQSIHNYSYRKTKPFVAINCAALPESLLESELFGYEDGAFTGASKKGKKGLFEMAHNGTIFLDEINSISLHFQARLLRVLQEKEVVRIGGTKVIPINVRVIAAANEQLIDLVKTKEFRADLYYRINVLKINLPSLRNRSEDILPLAKQYLLCQNEMLYSQLEPFLETLISDLEKHDFPGNVRELHNILERFSILCELSSEIDLGYAKQMLIDCIDEQLTEKTAQTRKVEFELQENYQDNILEAERMVLAKYLEMLEGDKSTLAKKLGIGRTTLYRKLKYLNIQ